MTTGIRRMPALLMLVLILCLAAPVHAATITVTGNGDAAATDGVCTLREAIANANNDADGTGGDCAAGSGADEIVFAADYTLTLGSALPTITTDLTLTGTGEAGTVIDGNSGDYRCVTVSGGTAAISGLTIRNCGATTLLGVGIYNSATLTLTGVTVKDNWHTTEGAAPVSGGGGIYNTGSLVVTRSTVSGNSVTGIYGTLSGGGIYNAGGTVAITHSTISGNSAVTNGGGIYNSGTMTITNTTVSGNTANKIFSQGGGIASSGTLTITHSTITGNDGPADAGGVERTGGTLTLSNTIVAGQAGGDADCKGVITSDGHNLDSDGSCGLSGTGDVSNGTANLGALADNGGPTWTHALLDGSDAIDAGDCAGGTVTDDQRGESRPRGLACDIGAYEAPPRAYAGDSATGSGQITASFTGGGDGCVFTTNAFIPVSAVAADPPAGVLFPHGLFDFTLGGCEEASTVEITITYPLALPAGTQYWKYGPTPGNTTPHWYVIPAVFDGNTVTFSITDGGLGDDDLTPNGTIVDQGGPGVPGDAIPTLSQWALLLLMLLLTGLGLRRMRGHGTKLGGRS